MMLAVTIFCTTFFLYNFLCEYMFCENICLCEYHFCRSGIAGSRGYLLFNIFRNSLIFFQKAVPFCIPTTNVPVFQFLYISLLTSLFLLISLFFIMAILVDVVSHCSISC